MALVPALIIPLLLVGGFFAPLNQVHDFFRVFEYISMFKYGYQTMVESQFVDDYLYINGETISTITLESEFDFDVNFYFISVTLLAQYRAHVCDRNYFKRSGPIVNVVHQ